VAETGLAGVDFMACYDFRGPRLFVPSQLRQGAAVPLEASQTHYLGDVLRLDTGDVVLIFNGSDGEWKARLDLSRRRHATVIAQTLVRPQSAPGNLHYLFSPLKHARLDYLVQKAVEMGASHLVPVIMRHTAAQRVNLARMHANAIEAAEQCGILAIPQIAAPHNFADALGGLAPSRRLIFCDEEAPCADPAMALRTAFAGQPADGGIAVIIGPEGGFAEDERARLIERPNTARISLGPRILRADTAAVAALAVIQAAIGDWR
jgi:16S rRNA (uracil1498-N3)-methyltransferase